MSGCRSSAGSEIERRSLQPVSHHNAHARAERGDDTPIEWVAPRPSIRRKPRDAGHLDRGPCGEVDPIKVAGGRYLVGRADDPLRLVPRTNRGIFAIKRAPQPSRAHPGRSAERARERRPPDRGYKSACARRDARRVANAEDLHEPGRHHPAQGPLRSQIRTHYPLDSITEMDVVGAGGAPARRRRSRGVSVRISSTRSSPNQPAERGARRTSTKALRHLCSRLSDRELRHPDPNAMRRSLRTASTRCGRG